MGFKISISGLHLYAESTYGHNIAQTKFLEPLPTFALKLLTCENVLWLNINLNWFLYKTNSCPGKLVFVYFSYTVFFYLLVIMS